ncbi:serine/threonine-protein kinase, partial [Thalassoroseus pseudoceratinae]|uniref:serine/threonine-protein kinase n=1 Tax=Thalassoroseus pseudoceratinae TaxID=2713176 RepID=UPI0014230380
MPESLAERFQVLWNQHQSAPDVFAFLEQHSELDREGQLAVLRVDQQHRWRTEQSLTVEEYLARLPDLAGDLECKAELAVGEFQARQNGESSPSVEEFLSRFSDISDTLRQKLSNSNTSSPSVAFATTEDFDSTQLDQQIGRYRILRDLSEGAFGRVMLAFDEELERQVAIKVPKPERFQSGQDAELYLAEARMVASFDHPHIVPVYDMGRSDEGAVYVVSKFIEGCTLADRIKQDRPSPDESAKLLAVVAEALHHAHQKRLIHRDIKPANILIEESAGTPYVADFGLAIKEEDYLKSGRLAGTPAYMSPEQARGEGHRLDGRSDIFSVGIIFYELLTGKRPFCGSSSHELMVQISTTEP